MSINMKQQAIREFADFIRKKYGKRIEKIISHHTGRPLDKVKKDTDRDYFMSAEEAKAYGIVDSVVETIKKKK